MRVRHRHSLSLSGGSGDVKKFNGNYHYEVKYFTIRKQAVAAEAALECSHPGLFAAPTLEYF